MKKWITAITALAAIGAQAATIGFTSAEGYSTGNLNAHADWNAKQWTVDATAGTASEDGYNSAIYTAEPGTFGAGLVITVSSTFTFTEGFDTSTQKWKPLFNTGFSDGNNASALGNQLVLGLDRADTGYTADLQADWGSTGGDNVSGTGGANNSGTLTAASVGITRGVDEVSSDLESDRITMTFQLTAGATVADWTAVSSLYNEDTSSQVAQFTTTGLSFDATTLYGSFGVGQSDSNANISNRTVHDFEITVIPEPATLGLVAMFAGAVMFIRRRFMM